MWSSLVPLLGVLLSLAVCPAAAQTTPAPASGDATRFQTDVVVTPERGETIRSQVPAATAVLDAEALKSRPVVSLGEALAFLPGFQIDRSAFHAGMPLVSARGFFGGGEADYVLLLVDGVPVADPESGLVDWSIVSLSSIRRLEAFRGPGASMYGDAAVGGVIQVLTNRSGQGSELTASGGSFDTATFDGSHRRRFGATTADFSGLYRRTAGFTTHSDARYASGTAALDGRVGASIWRVTGGANRRANEDPGALSPDVARRSPGASDPLNRFDEVQRHGFSGAFLLQRSATAWGHQERIYTTTREEDQTRTILLFPGYGDRQARALSTRTIGGSAEAERRFGPGPQAALIRFGLDLARQNVATSYRPVNEEGQPGDAWPRLSGWRVRSGAFVSSGWSPHRRWRATGAVRWDRVDDGAFGSSAGESHQAWSPRIGWTYSLSETKPVWVYSQVSRAFKVPTLNQLFDPRPYPDFEGGTVTISNRALVPQRATNFEAGLQGGSGRLRWSALAYRMHVEDEIDFDVRTFTYGNIGESRHTGIELEAGGPLGRYVQPSVRYVLSTVRPNGTGRQLKNIPRHNLFLASQVMLPGGLEGMIQYRRSAGAYLDDGNQLAIDGRSTLDLRVRRGFARHQLFLDVVNLTNDRYEDYGFTFSDIEGGLTSFVYAGAPRAVRAGITLGF